MTEHKNFVESLIEVKVCWLWKVWIKIAKKFHVSWNTTTFKFSIYYWIYWSHFCIKRVIFWRTNRLRYLVPTPELFIKYLIVTYGSTNYVILLHSEVLPGDVCTYDTWREAFERTFLEKTGLSKLSQFCKFDFCHQSNYCSPFSTYHKRLTRVTRMG
jgi:hypothetical protein